jgi:hypothetical protein
MRRFFWQIDLLSANQNILPNKSAFTAQAILKIDLIRFAQNFNPRAPNP